MPEVNHSRPVARSYSAIVEGTCTITRGGTGRPSDFASSFLAAAANARNASRSPSSALGSVRRIPDPTDTAVDEAVGAGGAAVRRGPTELMLSPGK